jgi:hypothetical protein
MFQWSLVEELKARFASLPSMACSRRGVRTPLIAEIEDFWSRKAWSAPLGIEEYQGLVRRSVEARQRSHGDVEFLEWWDDDVAVVVRYVIHLPDPNLRVGLEHAQRIQGEILEAAEAVVAGIEDLVAAAAKRLEGWGVDPLDSLLDRMRQGTSHERGLTLEELSSRLLATVPGFSATGHVATATEEIDIRIQNASEDEVWRRESALLLAECKNWSTKCGKNEFTLFKDKLRNRTGRVSCGFLISWHGFAETVTAQMLRGTEGNLLVVPISGADLRAAVREHDFAERLKRLREDAVLL